MREREGYVLTHRHSKDEEDRPNVGREGQDLEGGEEGQPDENWEDDGIHLPHSETHSVTVVSSRGVEVKGHIMLRVIVMVVVVDLVFEAVCSPLEEGVTVAKELKQLKIFSSSN